MAKKPKDETPNANSVPNKDIIQRLNFLYQAGVYLNGVTSQSPSSKKESYHQRSISQLCVFHEDSRPKDSGENVRLLRTSMCRV